MVALGAATLSHRLSVCCSDLLVSLEDPLQDLCLEYHASPSGGSGSGGGAAASAPAILLAECHHSNPFFSGDCVGRERTCTITNSRWLLGGMKWKVSFNKSRQSGWASVTPTKQANQDDRSLLACLAYDTPSSPQRRHACLGHELEHDGRLGHATGRCRAQASQSAGVCSLQAGGGANSASAATRASRQRRPQPPRRACRWRCQVVRRGPNRPTVRRSLPQKPATGRASAARR